MLEIEYHEPGAKGDQGKIRPHLCFRGFARALEAVARVSTDGAEKYTEDGWQQVEDGVRRYQEAMIRHYLKVCKDEETEIDPQTGQEFLHRAQIAWNSLASLELWLREQEEKSAAVRRCGEY